MFSTRLERELIEALDQEAADRGLSRSDLVRTALEAVVDPTVLAERRDAHHRRAVLEALTRDEGVCASSLSACSSCRARRRRRRRSVMNEFGSPALSLMSLSARFEPRDPAECRRLSVRATRRCRPRSTERAARAGRVSPEPA
jgi:Arc/MetJ-type ribon-helix-helix transcriptional regulator